MKSIVEMLKMKWGWISVLEGVITTLPKELEFYSLLSTQITEHQIKPINTRSKTLSHHCQSQILAEQILIEGQLSKMEIGSTHEPE
jgi:hypothetical protein